VRDLRRSALANGLARLEDASRRRPAGLRSDSRKLEYTVRDGKRDERADCDSHDTSEQDAAFHAVSLFATICEQTSVNLHS
jgi:hypothetical protein